ncbi:MAG: hypothetical protein DRZ82_03580 [Thermoprotei archaeon]|nr:MAG: hypothetical protein DRZ82_03580 [Thermoprotei archaeon]
MMKSISLYVIIGLLITSLVFSTGITNSLENKEIPVGRRYAVVYYGWTNDYVTKVVLERNYTIVIAEPYFEIPEEWKERGIQVYVYLNVLGLWIDKLDWVKKNHPEWLLYTKDGKVAKYWYGLSFMCNIAVKSFQDYLINRAKEYLKKGFTGIFLDDVHLDINQIGGPQYDTPVYNETKYGKWTDALIQFIIRLKNETGAPLIYNAGWSPPSSLLMKYMDGVMLEAHPTTYVVTSDIESITKPKYCCRRWMDIIRVSLIAQEYAKKGKIVIALSYGESDDIYEFSYATVRLFDFYYWVSKPIIDSILNASVLNLDLGNPLGEYKVEGYIYYRLYEKGLVAVNPFKRKYSIVINVPDNWLQLKRINGEIYEVSNGKLNITLGPEEGMVLLLEKTGKPSQKEEIAIIKQQEEQGKTNNIEIGIIVDKLRKNLSGIAAVLIAIVALTLITWDYRKRKFKQS